MGVLTDIPCNKVITDKSKFVINPAYDTVLEVQKLYKEDTLTEFEKIDQTLKMLVRNKWNLRLLNPEEKQKLLSVITKRYVEVEKRSQIKKSPFPVLDFEKDGDYIYASFMQAYKIDLIEEQGRLPWKKFLYLFNGLPADTKIKQIMRIRQMPVPEYNGKNSKEIQEIKMEDFWTTGQWEFKNKIFRKDVCRMVKNCFVLTYRTENDRRKRILF